MRLGINHTSNYIHYITGYVIIIIILVWTGYGKIETQCICKHY